MANVVNLRQFRKRKKREEKQHAADESRKLFGISNISRKRARIETEIEARKLDGAKLSSDE